MRKANICLNTIFEEIPKDEREETRLAFAISDRLFALMSKRGLSKKQLADAIGKRPCEITRWLSGQHNFTLATIAMLSNFFGEPLIEIPHNPCT